METSLLEGRSCKTSETTGENQKAMPSFIFTKAVQCASLFQANSSALGLIFDYPGTQHNGVLMCSAHFCQMFLIWLRLDYILSVQHYSIFDHSLTLTYLTCSVRHHR